MFGVQPDTSALLHAEGALPIGSAPPRLCSALLRAVRASARSHTRSKCGQRQPKQHAITYRAKHALPNLAHSLSVWDTHVRPRSIWNCPNLNPGRWLMKLGQWVWLSIETEKSLTWRPEIEKWMKCSGLVHSNGTTLLPAGRLRSTVSQVPPAKVHGPPRPRHLHTRTYINT